MSDAVIARSSHSAAAPHARDDPEQQTPEEQQQEDDGQQPPAQLGDEEGGGPQDGSSSPRPASAARPSARGGSVRVEDEERPEEEQEEEQESRHAGMDSGQGPADDGNGGESRDLQEAAAEPLEELEQAQEQEQGSQTQQQRSSSPPRSSPNPDADAYPDGVGTDSYETDHPVRQQFDDDGGAEPDRPAPLAEADPSAADYEHADRGQFERGGGARGGATGAGYVMPDIIKVVINRAELELEAEEEEEREMEAAAAAAAAGVAHRPSASPSPSERTPEQVVYVQVIKDNLHHPKPFLGGFRHKHRGIVFHHAATQTARKKRGTPVEKFHRESQTVHIVSRSQQTAREAGTQMDRSDLLLDNSADRVISSRPYFTADELEALRDTKARDIQCFLRQCFAWRRVRRLREGKAEEVAREHAAQEEERRRAEEHQAVQINRRMHPRSKADFAVLLGELEAWRAFETARIKGAEGLSAEERASALQELLHKEVKLLQTIDRLRTTAGRSNALDRTQQTLEMMASPKEWSSREGDRIEVETPGTQRARELVDLYNALALRNLPRPERIDVLLHVRYTVSEYPCPLTKDLLDLLAREEDLMRRQRTDESMEALRKRVQNLFLQFVQTPAFNPEAANFQRVPEQAQQAVEPLAAAASTARVQGPVLASSLAKPAMLARPNTVTPGTASGGRRGGLQGDRKM